MGTGNFKKYNAEKYYVIGINGESENDEYYIDDCIDFFNWKIGELFKADPTPEPYLADLCRRNNRNYPSTPIASVTVKMPYNWDRFNDVKIHFFLNSGYYEGAAIDYDITIGYYGDVFTLIDYNSDSELLSDMHYSMKDSYYYDLFDEQILNMTGRTMLRWLRNRAEKACEELCDKVFASAAYMNNGEAIYC